MKKTSYVIAGLLLLAFFNVPFSNVFGQGTAFTYQGRLNDGASSANGTYNFTFTLFNTNTAGAAIGGPVTNDAVAVTNGLFTVPIDFGSSVWDGQTNWLQIGVATNGTTTFTPLTPRQQLTPVPYAIYAKTAGTVPATNLSGTIPLSDLPAALITNNQSSVTLSNTTLNGNLDFNDPVFYVSNTIPFLIVDGAADVFAGKNAGNLTTASLGGEFNVAVGQVALSSITNGVANVALGDSALAAATNGSYNVAVGFGALGDNPAGSFNVAIGTVAMALSTNESQEVAIGYQALANDNAAASAQTFTGFGENTAVGYNTLLANSNGTANTAIGNEALMSGNGADNTAIGDLSLYHSLTGHDNVAIGYSASFGPQTGNQNVIIGSQAGANVASGNDNVAIGYSALDQEIGPASTGNNNIAIGSGAASNYLSSESGNIAIGNAGSTGDNNTIRIGTQGKQTTTLIAGVYGGTLPGGSTIAPVIIDSNGHLVTPPTTSFTPTIGDGTHNFTTSTHTGSYVAIGNVVYFE